MSSAAIGKSALAILAEIHTVNVLMRDTSMEYLCMEMEVKDFALFNLIRKVWEQKILEANSLQRQLFEFVSSPVETEVMIDLIKNIDLLLEHIKARSHIMTVYLKKWKERRTIE